MPRFNLVLVAMRGEPENTTGDLREIARRVSEIDSRINAIVLPKGLPHRLMLSHLWAGSTLSVAMQRSGGRSLLPGRIVTSKILLKSGEYRRLETAGFPVPGWTLITPGTKLDPADWGPYVVEKPNDGGRGARVRIKRTGKIRYKLPDDNDAFGKRGVIAQKFIYTGEWPESFRVMTLFGQCILCFRQQTVGRGRPLLGRWGFTAESGTSIVSNTIDMEVGLTKQPDVVSLCEQAHRMAFPDVPLLGSDVIRDADTGKLYILECHAHGPVWPFSTSRGLGIQRKNGLDFASQYDALRKCAEILAEATPRLATRRLPFQSVDGRWT